MKIFSEATSFMASGVLVYVLITCSIAVKAEKQPTSSQTHSKIDGTNSTAATPSKSHDKNTKSASPKILISWDKVNRTGYLRTLISDPQFLQLPLDLRIGNAQEREISYAEMKRLLDLPIVSDHLGDFVKEAIVGKSNLNFNFIEKDFDSIMKLLLSRLGEKKEGPTASALIKAVSGDDSLSLLKFQGMWANLNQSETPALAPLIKHIIAAKNVEIRHTTREVPPSFNEEPAVPGFEVFPAGRFGVTFKDVKGTTKYLVVETEAGPGHLQPVIPGKTQVNGYVAESKDDNFDTGMQFSSGDTKKLLVKLVNSWGKPDTIKDFNKKTVLLSIAAVYADGDVDKLKRALNIKK